MLVDIFAGKMGLSSARDALDEDGGDALGAALAVEEHAVHFVEFVFAADEEGVGTEALGLDEIRGGGCSGSGVSRGGRLGEVGG